MSRTHDSHPAAAGHRPGSRRRREQIVRLATRSGLASVEELAATFNVTASTIRRDLALLTTDGRLTRTYGGAIATVPAAESPLRQRLGEAYPAKLGIARWAATRVRPGSTVLLDAGSTVGALAGQLREVTPLTVATTGLTVLDSLADVKQIELLCLGGSLRHVSQGFVGPLAEAALDRLSFDQVFLGADGVSAADGICEAGLDQSRLKELMARRSREVYVLADASKLGRRPFHAWAALPGGWTLVTDEHADPGAVAEFTAAGIRTVRAGENGTELAGG